MLDVLVIGAGHNGLVSAAYLARAGLQVKVFEAREVVGGACVTEELIPGFRCSSCAYVAGLFRPEILRDLDLKNHGLKLYGTDVLNCSIGSDGGHFFLWPELDRTLEEVERLAPGEAERFALLGSRMQRFASIVSPWLLVDPPPLSDVLRTFEDLGELELFEEFTLLSIKDLLDRYLRSEELKGLLTFFAIVSAYGGPETPGTAYEYGHHSWGEFEGRFGQYGFARGGMGSISDAVASAARAHGAEIQTGSSVTRILVEGGRAAGVELASGEEIRAGSVVANCDPIRTFKMVDPGVLSDDFLLSIEQFDVRGSMARVHFALDGLPTFTGFARGEGPEHRGMTLLGAETERFEQAWEAQRRGRIPDELAIELTIPSVHDQTIAPHGKHLLITGIQQLPFKLEGTTWDEMREPFTRLVIETIERYAPGFERLISDTATITPLDLERDYGLPGGNIFHGAMGVGQLFSARPHPSAGQYATPLPGLYLCGSGTHPGGGVMGANGHNAAQRVLRDRAGVGAAPARRPARPTGMTIRDRAMAHPTARRWMVRMARQRWMRPIVRAATRNRGDS